MEIYFHIGMPKSGSSTIQRFLHANAEKLLQDNIYYPLVPPIPDSEATFHINGSFFIENRDLEPYHAFLKYHNNKEEFESIIKEAEIKKSEKIIFSNEAYTFSDRFKRKDIDFLLNFKHQVKFIVYLKPAILYLTSLWGEYISWGDPRWKDIELENFCVENYYNNVVNDIYFFAKTFGLNSIILRPLEKSSLVQDSITHDLLSLLGVNNFDKYSCYQQYSNQGFSRIELERILYMNKNLDCADKIGIATSIKGSEFDGVSIVNSLSNNFIEKIINLYRPVELKIAKDFLNKEDLFSNTYDDLLSRNKKVFKGLSKSEKESIKFILKQTELQKEIAVKLEYLASIRPDHLVSIESQIENVNNNINAIKYISFSYNLFRVYKKFIFFKEFLKKIISKIFRKLGIKAT